MTSIDITSNQREHGKIHGSHHGSKSCEICSLVASIKWLQSLTQWYRFAGRRSLSSEPLIITIRKGTVFQQKSWTHRCGLRRLADMGCWYWYGLAAKKWDTWHCLMHIAHLRSDLLTGLDYMVALLPESSTTKEMSWTQIPRNVSDMCILNDFDLSMWTSYQFEGI